MSQFFAGTNYTGPAFQLFGAAHLAALAFLVVLNIILIQFQNAGDGTKRTIRWTLAIILWTAETSWHIWNIATRQWNIQNLLPLNLCSILIWLSGFMLIFKNYTIYEFAYFLGIGGAMQYLITPDLGIYGFPHFRYFQTFTSHGLLVTSAIYMTVVEGFRPTWKSMLRVAFWTNVYTLIIYFVNISIGSDYLMINAKPATPSLLDLLPAWPYYIIWMELIGIATMLLLYSPFFVKDLRKKQPAAAGNAQST
jgi:hypothetical integral membrane protein (TIGR02206 family)